VKYVRNITVFDLQLSVMTEADESQVSALAEYLQKKYEEIKSVSSNAPRANVMALAALNVANEYFEARNKVLNLERTLEARSRKIIEKIEQSGASSSEDETMAP